MVPILQGHKGSVIVSAVGKIILSVGQKLGNGDVVFKFRPTLEDAKIVYRLAKALGLRRSDVFRVAIRMMYRNTAQRGLVTPMPMDDIWPESQ